MGADERIIRDNLAQQLSVLEPGLELIATEYALPSPHGSKGFIDILAKDVFGNRIIIELKRSNQVARQALHEIFKYPPLFRGKEGLPYGKIRCFVVSTEWHELAVPFAEFIRVSECQCEGFELRVNESGEILGASKHVCVTLPEPLTLFRLHSAFLFHTAAARDSSIEQIVETFKRVGGEGCFALAMEYEGPTSSVIYRSALYLVVAAVQRDLLTSLEYETRESLGPECDDEELRASTEDSFLERLMEDVQYVWDSFEIGYPEKFHTLVHTGWRTHRILRWGIVPTEAAVDDSEVERLIAGTEGENALQFYTFTSPRFGIQWEEVKANGHRCLLGNQSWLRGFEWFCAHTETNFPFANLSFAIYNPLNFLVAFFKLLVRNDPLYFPSFRVIAIDQHDESLSSLLGRIEWDGVTKPKSVEALFSPDFCSLEDYFLAYTMRAHWELDAAIMKRHGLNYALACATEKANAFEAKPVTIVESTNSLRCEEKSEFGKTVDEFIDSNSNYLMELMNWIERYQVGL